MDISLPAVLLGAFAGAEFTLGSLLLPGHVRGCLACWALALEKSC